MNRPLADERDLDIDVEEVEPGVTRVLTEEGWEASIYVDPGEDWRLQEDGSWSSPDGRTRSWPLAAPEPVPPD
jgi:hypothetical protein